MHNTTTMLLYQSHLLCNVLFDVHSLERELSFRVQRDDLMDLVAQLRFHGLHGY